MREPGHAQQILGFGAGHSVHVILGLNARRNTSQSVLIESALTLREFYHMLGSYP